VEAEMGVGKKIAASKGKVYSGWLWYIGRK
jgi:hypothetical protein